ncbi:LLM class flavin-dependent oxidoreductase [Ilumatobacter coccineus]|uniref:Putative oxidoreductase n=1 Tax=Ilumatobacter coccineus (strain NBRC 103263 / KCTC 29153 / YM16-304) TaxID=1313172 RepID=A0A6C7E706_ILUCY|nr:LLM class flavin-dependent oxidoreductase [Ilumatobacter coccineus]BAN00398.1 putative oxidoreductase [Ilumatobacter coccineus YM16-304]
MSDRVPLSVLDLAPVPAGVDAGEALRNSMELAQHAERLGYTRHWVAEHHNFPGIASSSPAVLIAHLAMATSTIRVGAGGVMLPNHASLTIAEQFGMLEALHPGRVDLGLGRAPGTDQVTAAALRRGPTQAEDGFPKQLGELLSYFDGSHPRITAVPAQGHRPALWMLGSSDYSAAVAGHLGVPFSFAHHFASGNTAAALAAYRDAFRPSQWLEQPYAMIGVPVVCADTTEHAEFLVGPSALSFTRLRQGRPIQLVTPEEVADYEWSPMEQELLKSWRGPQVIGDPTSVRGQLDDLVERFQVQELMITTMTHSHDDRMKSYELVANAWQSADVFADA